MASPRYQSGFALVEVLIALTVVTLASVGLVQEFSEIFGAVGRITQREREIQEAGEALTRVATWDNRKLAGSEGLSRVGNATIRVAARSHALFDVSVVDPGGEPVLSTMLFRPDSA